MELTSIATIVEAVGGRLVRGNPLMEIDRVLTDSRGDCTGALFIPLNGEKFDGHDFVAAAVKAGAAACIVSKDIDSSVPQNAAVIRVADTLAAYHAIAKSNRDKYDVNVIAITGSCGKTSTKNLMVNVLDDGALVYTEKNENNEIGAPKTLLRIGGDTRRAILEFGMRGPGEIAQLTAISNPTHAVITNIEPSHIGRLGSMEAIADAKGELLEHLPSSAKAFLNADSPWLERLEKKTTAEVITFGIESGDVRASDIKFTLEGVDFTLNTPEGKTEVSVPLPGRGAVYNSASVAAVALSLGESLSTISKNLSKPFGESGRMNKIKTPDGKLIIDDTYNSSPSSLKLALELLGKVNWPGRRAAVLADMLELGDFSKDEHFNIGLKHLPENLDLLITFGEEAASIANGAIEAGFNKDNCFVYMDFDMLAEDIVRHFTGGELVLVKGSRGMKLERAVNLLGGTR